MRTKRGDQHLLFQGSGPLCSNLYLFVDTDSAVHEVEVHKYHLCLRAVDFVGLAS